MIARLLLTALMAETLSAVAFMADPPRGPVPTTLSVALLDLDTEYFKNVTRSKTEFKILIHQDTNRSLFVTVSPCNARINWDFKFVPVGRNAPMILGNNTLSGIGITLIEYTGVSTSVTYEHVKTHNGLYAISIQSIDEESEVTFSLSLKQKTPKKLSFRPNGIKIKTGGQKISLRWNLSHKDYHLMEYSLVVSTSKVYFTLCEAKSRLKELKTRFLSQSYAEDDDLPLDDGLKILYLGSSTNYTMTDLNYGETYYFTVFALSNNRTPTFHANATYTFERPKPVALKDAVPAAFNLKARSGKASFRYKIGMRAADVGGGPKTLYWYVMPCGGVVNVEIRCKKKMLVRKRVFGYEKIVVDDVGFGERYLLKVETVSADETQRVGSVEVMATTRPTMFPMPDMPNDLSIRQYPDPNDCKSITIGWLPAKSHRNLTYCVYLIKPSQSNSVDFLAKPNQCELSYGYGRRRIADYVYRKKIHCYPDTEKGKVLIEKLLRLKELKTYTIQVTVRKPRGRTLSYDLLKLDTHSCGIN